MVGLQLEAHIQAVQDPVSHTRRIVHSYRMVATGRQARSAKNRLARSRVAVPVSFSSLQLPAGCPANAKDIDELVHGETALQQLCALKAIGMHAQCSFSCSGRPMNQTSSRTSPSADASYA